MKSEREFEILHVQTNITAVKGLISTCNLIRLPQTTLGILGMQSYVLGRAFARLASGNTQGLNARKTPQFAGVKLR